MSVHGDTVADVTGKMAQAQLKNAESVQRSRDAGWVEPEKYDYDAYNANPKEPGEAPLDPAFELPTWAANAIKYEWKDEYGDVGPAHPELEAMLFGKDNRVIEGSQRGR